MLFRFFDFSKTVARRAFRVIQVDTNTCSCQWQNFFFFLLDGISLTFTQLKQDTHNVRSVSFHPSGEFLLAGTFSLVCKFDFP